MPKDKNQQLAVSNQRSGLKWNGKGSLSDIPARDLTDAEVKEFGGYEKLIASGCYEAIDAKFLETVDRQIIGSADDLERLLGGPVDTSEE